MDDRRYIYLYIELLASASDHCKAAFLILIFFLLKNYLKLPLTKENALSECQTTFENYL